MGSKELLRNLLKAKDVKIEDIENVKVENILFLGRVKLPHIVLEVKDIGEVQLDRVDELTGVIKEFQELVPDKLDDSLKKYLITDTKTEFNIADHPRIPDNLLNLNIMTGVGLFMIVVMIIVPIGIMLSEDFGVIIPYCTYLFISLFIIGLVFLIQASPRNVNKLYLSGKGDPDGIPIIHTLFMKLFLATPKKIPSGQIISVTRIKERWSFEDQCRIELVSGKKYDVDITVFVWAVKTAGFKLQGNKAINPKPDKTQNLKLFKPSIQKFGVFGLFSIWVLILMWVVRTTRYVLLPEYGSFNAEMFNHIYGIFVAIGSLVIFLSMILVVALVFAYSRKDLSKFKVKKYLADRVIFSPDERKEIIVRYQDIEDVGLGYNVLTFFTRVIVPGSEYSIPIMDYPKLRKRWLDSWWKDFPKEKPKSSKPLTLKEQKLKNETMIKKDVTKVGLGELLFYEDNSSLELRKKIASRGETFGYSLLYH